jgi:HK97 family phage prohead protease
MERIKINDATLIGEWSEVTGLSLEKITKRAEDEATTLDGLIIKGYEMKWSGVNENGERYDRKAFDDFITNYFVGHGLNMPVTMQHSSDAGSLIGRVLYLETNSVGFYFVIYVPRALPVYETVKALVSEGILQGLSKEGWATAYHWDKDDVLVIDKMDLLGVSLVTTPANRLKIESAGEIKNALRAKLQSAEDKSLFDQLFS